MKGPGEIETVKFALITFVQQLQQKRSPIKMFEVLHFHWTPKKDKLKDSLRMRGANEDGGKMAAIRAGNRKTFPATKSSTSCS